MADRVAIVTGAAGGLGRVMVTALLRARLAVGMVDRRGDTLEQFAAELSAEFGPDAVLAGSVDITDQAECERYVALVSDRLGVPSVLVNNAALGPGHVEEATGNRSTWFWEADPVAWRQVVEVNVTGTFLMARAVAPAMIEQDWGRIVNISTGLGTMQRAAFSPYGGSKAAIEAHSISWSKELSGTGVSVNTLLPGGAVDTPLVTGEVRAALAAQGQKLLSAEVMVAPLLWLCSSASDGTTGIRLVAVR